MKKPDQRLKITSLRLRLALRKIFSKTSREIDFNEAILEAASQSTASITAWMHVRSDDQNGIRLDLNWSTGACERLLSSMAVRQDTPVKQTALLVKHFPPVCV